MDRLPQTLSFLITMTPRLRYVKVIRRWGPWQGSEGEIFHGELVGFHFCCYVLGRGMVVV